MSLVQGSLLEVIKKVSQSFLLVYKERAANESCEKQSTNGSDASSLSIDNGQKHPLLKEACSG